MDAIHAICVSCHASITLDLPDAWLNADGEIIDASVLNDADALWCAVYGVACPNCGPRHLRVTLPGEH